jgi:hypothetical protein
LALVELSSALGREMRVGCADRLVHPAAQQALGLGPTRGVQHRVVVGECMARVVDLPAAQCARVGDFCAGRVGQLLAPAAGALGVRRLRWAMGRWRSIREPVSGMVMR